MTALLTRQELLTALRRENVESPDDVKLAYLEPDGRITVIRKKKEE